MALILHIDTAVDRGSVCLALDGRVMGTATTPGQQDQAALLAPLAGQVLKDCGLSLPQLHAIAVSAGPGSYTGLRVGLSMAKGWCYGLDIPLIAVNTLEMMAAGLKGNMEATGGRGDYFCPMIDARRMEVFTALYDRELHPVVTPAAVVLGEDFMEAFRDRHVQVFGSGRDKAQRLLGSRPAWAFPDFEMSAAHLVPLAEQRYREGRFEDLAYFEPFYYKAFHSPGHPPMP